MKERPEVLPGKTIRVRTGCGNAYISVCKSDGYMEVLAALGKSGGCPSAFMQSITRIITVALNYNVPIDELHKQLYGIKCPNSTNVELSCPDAVAVALTHFERD